VKRHLLVPLAALSAIYGQLPAPNQPPSLVIGRAELLNALKSPNLKPGDLFYLRTLDPWRQNGCSIPPHTTITGRVENPTPSPAHPHDTILALRFSELPCSGSSTTLLTPVLVSIDAPSPNRYDGNPVTSFRDFFPNELDPTTRSTQPTSDAENAAIQRYQLNEMRVTEKPMKAGEVRGYRGIALDLPLREDPVAKLSSNHNIVLNRATEFIFAYVPTPTSNPEFGDPAPPPVSVSALRANPAAPSPPPEEPEDVCASSGCRELAPVPETRDAHALWSLPLAELGYQPRPVQRILGLDHSASVHFLGEDQLLLTFTRHVLMPRSPDSDSWATNLRSVRGVLISRADGHLLLVKDWIVSDDIGPFAWSFGNGVVIAHVGHDLVRFGPGLTIQQRFRLAGPLFLLTTSPRRDLLLAVTIHEKHSREQHAQIANTIGPSFPVDEEYDLTGLNADLKMTGTRHETVAPLRPALLEQSMVSARPLRGMDWLLEESTWQGESKRFAHFRSACPLQIESFPGDLLFIQGCEPVGAGRWYRVLNTHGATLFKGVGPPTDLIQQADSSDDGRLFAIALSHFKKLPVDRSTQLQIQDFTNLTVTVYDTATGKQCFAAHPRQGSSESDTFSLSPSASTLAVLTSTSLQLFPLPTPAAKK